MLHFNFNMSDNPVEQIPRGSRVALGVTGGIAAYKSIEVLRGLQRAGCDVRVAMTRHACEFIQPLTFRALSGSYVLVDDYAADNPDPIAHITFSQTVDLFIIAPATANVIAKMANGVADDFITTTYLACKAPVVVAPAMNTTMWQHPANRRNLQRLIEDGVHIIEPDDGEMACGTIGPGRLSQPEKIVTRALQILGPTVSAAAQTLGDLRQERILITTGATREAIDPVRFISNRSSGRMGFALADAARCRGAQVKVVAGITSVAPPDGVEVLNVSSAAEMHSAVSAEISQATAFISAAAVSDYRVKDPAATKLKKSQAEMELHLVRTTDILGEVARHKRSDQIVIGFAAETENLLAYAREKLLSKQLDAVVANNVAIPESGFDSDNNQVSILLADEAEAIDLPLLSKSQVAHRILDELIKLRRRKSKASAA